MQESVGYSNWSRGGDIDNMQLASGAMLEGLAWKTHWENPDAGC